MPKVRFVDPAGGTQIVDGKVGDNLMFTAKCAGISGIDGDCGGSGACATCHVYVDPEYWGKLPPAEDSESTMLEFAIEPSQFSRLSCQIILTPELDGLKITTPVSQR